MCKNVQRSKPLMALIVLIGFMLSHLSSFADTIDMAPIENTVIPFTRLPGGQYVINVYINDQGPFHFMIDTAATRTAIFEKTRMRIKVEMQAGAESFVNGITTSRYRPFIMVHDLHFAHHSFPDHKVIVLEDISNAEPERLDGILGQDILSEMVLSFAHSQTTLSIGKKAAQQKLKTGRWTKIRLKPNPYKVPKYNLFFAMTKIGRKRVPTLIDTGANFTAINWKSVKGTVVEKELKKLREDWVVLGAVGVFKPKKIVRLDKIWLGQSPLENHSFLMMDFEKLPLNAYGKYPLAIAGIDIFSGQDFILNFPDKKIYIQKKSGAGRLKTNGAVINTGLKATRIENRVGQ